MLRLPYSTSPPEIKPPQPVDFDTVPRQAAVHPKGYLPDEDLVDAVRVALLLQQPLLVTGEPGTGKSQLAHSLAYQLGLEKPLVFETKSTSVSRDLFYQFDAVSKFQQAQDRSANLDDRDREFISYHALGLAFLRSQPWENVARVASERYRHDTPRRSVVLIDEIDKAPRDFPNDILNEIEHMYFVIPELKHARVEVEPSRRPIVVMTSNSEKGLPDPFLRRCIFHNIKFPERDRLEQIILNRVEGTVRGGPALADALDILDLLRKRSNDLDKLPGTAELLNWVTALTKMEIDLTQSLRGQWEVVKRTLGTLAKNAKDQGIVQQVLKEWLGR